MSIDSTATPPARSGQSIGIIIAAAGFVLAVSFGLRSVFGIVLEPVSDEFGWPREVFSLSLAIQNLVWGAAQPFFGAIADRWGDRKALWLGFVCYALGMGLFLVAGTPLGQHLASGLLVGAGISGTAFGLVLAVVSRASSDERRSQNLGIVSALGSSGQVVIPLLLGWMLAHDFDWRESMALLSLLLLPMALCIPLLKAETPRAAQPGNVAPPQEVALMKMLGRAATHPSYILLVFGFFVCGFHVAFITVHLPAFAYERCGDPSLGGIAIAVVGAMNVLGTLGAGQLGARFPKQYLLSAIYALRAVVIFLFISFPVTPLSVILFAIGIGPLWLSTVPLTSGLIVTMFGPKTMATLWGIVFFSHQIGSFLGVYLGGRFYDMYGSYDIIWWAAIALGIFSALVHLPVREAAWSAREPA
ncbi:MAG: MFS transporter [Neomegalonema sp.]|nr:MFS transporter [Neomegalonema sp.]